MSEHTTNHQSHDEQPKARKREMSRRQFLNYTLGGTGGFLIGIPLVWNLRFAIDPLLQAESSSSLVKTIEASAVTATPTAVKFKAPQVDGWYYSEPELEAWIARDANGEIYALSPTCKHLGCTVSWAPAGRAPDEFFCPCHGARYNALGKELAVATAPLDEYHVEIIDGYVYLGKLKANTRV
jgi:menaquinol-cytochrome c reductase iron-sulfur subunit